MNRRQFLGSVAGVTCTSVTYADCRDKNRMIQPDESKDCHDLVIRGLTHSDRQVGRALFGFGAYEELLEYHRHKKVFPFAYKGGNYGIRVASLSVDVNREIGCVVCEVKGALYDR